MNVFWIQFVDSTCSLHGILSRDQIAAVQNRQGLQPPHDWDAMLCAVSSISAQAFVARWVEEGLDREEGEV